MVPGSIASENRAETLEPIGTFTVPFSGFGESTNGGVVSDAGLVTITNCGSEPDSSRDEKFIPSVETEASFKVNVPLPVT